MSDDGTAPVLGSPQWQQVIKAVLDLPTASDADLLLSALAIEETLRRIRREARPDLPDEDDGRS